MVELLVVRSVKIRRDNQLIWVKYLPFFAGFGNTCQVVVEKKHQQELDQQELV